MRADLPLRFGGLQHRRLLILITSSFNESQSGVVAAAVPKARACSALNATDGTPDSR
jgi:hypothetical protein